MEKDELASIMADPAEAADFGEGSRKQLHPVVAPIAAHFDGIFGHIGSTRYAGGAVACCAAAARSSRRADTANPIGTATMPAAFHAALIRCLPDRLL